jgi:hypothetical protein
MRRIVMRPSGASCSRKNSAKLSLATILNPQLAVLFIGFSPERHFGHRFQNSCDGMRKG